MDRFRMLPSYHYEDNIDGNLLKSVGKPLRDYKIEGNCFQDGTPSPDNPIDIQCCGEKTVNLFKGVEEYRAFDSNYETYGNGFKVAPKLDGGYDSRLCFLLLDDGVFEWGETYTFSCDVSPSIMGMNSLFRIGYVVPNTGRWRDFGLKAINNISKCELTVTLPSEPPEGFYKTTAYPYDVSECLALNINIQVATLGELGALTVTNIQLQKGNTATPYEPYGYKVPVTVGGKNLFDINGNINTRPNNGAVINDQRNYIVGENQLNVCGSSASNLGTGQVIKVQTGDTYMASFRVVNISGGNIGVTIYKHGTTEIIKTAYGYNIGDVVVVSFTATTDEILVGFNKGGVAYGDTGCIIENIQLQKGDTSTAYEPYIPPKTYNIYLDEPLRKVGDYADYVDFKNGKVVRNVENHTTENINNELVQKNADYNDYKSFYINRSQLGQMQESFGGVVMSNNFQHSLWKDIEKSEGNYVWTAGSSTGFRIHKNFLNGYDECTNDSQRIALFKQWVIDNNVNLMYIKDTLTETPISLPQILTEKHTNIISVGTTLQPSKVNYQYYKGGK